MNVGKIHISHLMLFKTFNIKTPIFKELANLYLVNKYWGLTTNVFKYKNETVTFMFNKKVIICGNKKIKLNNKREFDFLCLIKRGLYTGIKLKEDIECSEYCGYSYIHNSMLKNVLYQARVRTLNSRMEDYVKDVEEELVRICNIDGSGVKCSLGYKDHIRVFFLKNSMLFADESLIRLEIANALCNEPNIKNHKNIKIFINKVNEYYSLANNIENNWFIDKNNITPHKTKIKSSDYLPLPQKIFDLNFKKLSSSNINFTKSDSKSERNNKNTKIKLNNKSSSLEKNENIENIENKFLFEMFINKNINSISELNLIHNDLSNFLNLITKSQSQNTNFISLIKNYRRKTRVDITKHFRHKNNKLKIFLDLVIFTNDNPDKILSIIEEFLQYLIKNYI